MRILVTGAYGFIGRHLTKALAGQHEVFGVVRKSAANSDTAIQLVELDLSKPFDASELPANVDVIVQLAQANVPVPEHVEELWAVNTFSTKRLLDYARATGARRFILASTGDVYGRRFDLCKVDDQPRPDTLYALSKRAAELVTEANATYLHTCILRLFHVYGPGQSNRLIPRLADRIRQGQSIKVHPGHRPRFTPIYIDDAVNIMIRAIELSYSGTVNVAGDEIIGIRDLANKIGLTLASTPVFETNSEEIGDTIGDNELMKKVFGGPPMTALSDGLSRTFAPQGKIA